jgi:hypothetical protein
MTWASRLHYAEAMKSRAVVMAIVVAAVAAGVAVMPRAARGQTANGQGLGGAAKAGVNPRAEAVSAFNKRLEAYLELRKKAESGFPALGETDDPAKITAHEKALGDAVRQMRPTARPGDIFGTDMTPLILEIVRADWKKRPAVDRAAIMEGMPKPFVPTINMRYPVGQPLTTFPPNLLNQLHQLPDDLEYRFVGRDLILRDVKANIIVDVIRHALPSARTS